MPAPSELIERLAPDVAGAIRQRRGLQVRGHRPWPLPDAPWIMGQSWQRLLFAHWAVSPEALRAVVHPRIPIDTFDGQAWIGVTPFTVTGLHFRVVPPLPVVSRFHEINVRTYSTVDGRPGIYFFSLDAASRLAVEAARRVYRVPYFRAAISVDRSGDRVRYESERVQGDGPPAAFRGEYGPVGPVANAVPGTFDHWCTERYCLYTVDDEQRICRGEIHHPPWPLQPASLSVARNSMGAQIGLELTGEPTLHYAARQDVTFWPPAPLD
jgi:uncharacterized protein YqjF (DUF2071 family)